MAGSTKKSSETKITRISATDSGAKKSTKKAKVVTDKKPVVVEGESTTRRNPFVRIGQYFKGAWYELRQVRWPDRKSTWGMTGALIVFTLVFLTIIVLLDFGFSELFKLILGSN